MNSATDSRRGVRRAMGNALVFGRLHRAAAAGIDPLEPRRLLATLVVNGGDGDDRITFKVDSNFIYAIVNNIVIPQPVAAWDDVQINGQGGNDDILIMNTGDEPVDIFPGTGADVLSVCSFLSFDPDDPPAQDLDQLSARVYVHAGTDATDDTLEISDAFDAGDDEYDIDETPGPMRLVKPDVPGNESEEVWWGESNLNVEIDTNPDDNTINVASNVAMGGTDETLTILEAGGGNETLTFNGSIGADNQFTFTALGGDDTMLLVGDAFSGNATIVFDASTGADLLTVSDSAATEAYNLSIASGGGHIELVDGAQTGVIRALNVSAIGLSSTHATQGSTFDVQSLQTDLSISAGGGNDTFNLPVAGSAQNFTFGGGSGTDAITLDASGFGPGADFTHTFDNASYDNTASFGLLSWSSTDSVTFNGSPGIERFVVDTGMDLATLTLNGNDDTDTFTVRPNTGTDIFCNGGLPTTGLNERLTLIGAGANGGILTPNGASGGTYTFANRDPVTFTGIEVFTLPAAGPSQPDLAAADDTGISDTDNITNDTSLNFSGTGALASAPVRLYRDGTQVASATGGTGGSYAFANVAFPTGDDTFAMVARYDTVATGLLSLPSPALNVRVDTVAPAPPGPADMDPASDTGISNTDNITRDNTPTFTGTVTANDIIRLFANGVAVGSDTSTAGGSYSIITSVLLDGTQIITARQEDLAGNLSAAGPGLVTLIDTVVPPLPTAAPDLIDASDTGVSNTDNITRDNTPTFTGSAPGNHIVRLMSGGTEVGFVQLPAAVTTYNVTSSTLADGNRFMAIRFEDVAGNQSTSLGPTLPIRIDTVAPTLTSSVFNFLTSQNLKFTFNEDVGGGIGVGDLTLRDMTHGVNTPNSSLAMSYAPNTATVTFPGFAGGILTDADWQMKVAADVTDVAGNHFAGTNFDFFFLNGDANRDRRVNLNDFNIMVANFGQSPRDFSQGDFTYDGVVNLNDFNVLASRFGTVLGPGAAPAPDARDRLIDELA